MPKAIRRELITATKMREYEPPEAGYFLVYDQDVRRLAVAVHASGKNAFKFIYHFNGKTRWLTLGEMRVHEARKLGYELSDAVAKGKDPQAEVMEAKRADTFGRLVDRYFAEFADHNLRSANQTKYLLKKYVPAWFNSLKVTKATRGDVKAVVGPLQAKTPGVARQVHAAMSSVFQWGVEEALVIQSNPCRQITMTKGEERERVLSNEELMKFYRAFDDHGVAGAALRVLLLTGQRPGEVAAMRRGQIKDGWWELPAKPDGLWPGTKTKTNHRVWLPMVVQRQLSQMGQSQVFSDDPPKLLKSMRAAMSKMCKALGVERATPHDLRRTHGSTITRLLGFGGMAAMNRIQNHREGGVGRVYDRYGYEDEIKTVMEKVAKEMIRIVEGRPQFERHQITEIADEDIPQFDEHGVVDPQLVG